MNIQTKQQYKCNNLKRVLWQYLKGYFDNISKKITKKEFMEITTMNQTTMTKNIKVDKLKVKHVEEQLLDSQWK